MGCQVSSAFHFSEISGVERISVRPYEFVCKKPVCGQEILNVKWLNPGLYGYRHILYLCVSLAVYGLPLTLQISQSKERAETFYSRLKS